MKTIGFAAASFAVMAVAATGSRASTPSSDVTYLAAEQVTAAFSKGIPLVEVESYKVHASRRESAGQAEVHTRDTDIIHVLTGTATFVTGGTVVGGKSTGPEEVRGASIEGGQTRTLQPGDVVIVPNATPHWFKEVRGPLTYYVVKVRAAADPR